MPQIARFDKADGTDQEVRFLQRGAITGSVLGALTFIGGLALLALTFSLAYKMFMTNPSTLFDLAPGKTLDLSKAATLLMGVVVRILLLVVMAAIGGAVTKRGTSLYVDSRHASKAVVIKETQIEAKRARNEPADEDKGLRTG